MGFLTTLATGLEGGLGGIVGGLAQAGASIYNTKQVNKTNKDIAEQNLGFQKENLDYQKALQQEIFQREDTAHQREIEDLKKAGINPLATAGGNGANAGSVVPLTEMNNTYQAQTADMSGIGAAGAALDAAVQNEKALEDARQTRTMQHAQFVQELALREHEANLNMIKTMADIASHTEDNKLKKELEEAANKIAWANLYQQKKEYEENAKFREEQERQLKIANDRSEHDYNIDKKAGTKSGENQDARVTTAQRVITGISGTGNKKTNENLAKQVLKLNQTDALSLKVLTQQMIKEIPDATAENPKNKTIKQIKQYWEKTAKSLKANNRSQALIDMVKSLQMYGAVPNYK